MIPVLPVPSVNHSPAIDVLPNARERHVLSGRRALNSDEKPALASPAQPSPGPDKPKRGPEQIPLKPNPLIPKKQKGEELLSRYADPLRLRPLSEVLPFHR